MDIVTIAAVATVLTLVAFPACYIPGRRSTKLDPLIDTSHRMMTTKRARACVLDLVQLPA